MKTLFYSGILISALAAGCAGKSTGGAEAVTADAATAKSCPYKGKAEGKGKGCHHCKHGAGHGHGHGKKLDAKEHAQHLKAELKLTDEQTAKVEAVFEAKKGKFEELRAKKEATKEEMIAAKKEIHEGLSASFAEILSPEQQEAWKAMMEKHHGKKKCCGKESCPHRKAKEEAPVTDAPSTDT